MGNLRVILSSAATYARNRFQMVPWWLWLLQIVFTSFFSMAFFVILSDFIDNPEVSIAFVVIGNIAQSIAATTLYAVSDLPGTEKHVGTLSPLMETPASLFCIFLGMSFIHIAAGAISSALSIGYAIFIFNVDFSGANMLAVVAILVLTCLSLTGFGMAIGSVGLRLRTSAIIANLFSYIGLLICGINFPLSYLPEWVQWIANAFPLTYGARALRGGVGGSDLFALSNDVLTMILLGAIYFIISIVLFRTFEKKARRIGAYDMF